MIQRLMTMSVMLLVSSFALADLDYTSESPDFEQHKEQLSIYLQYGRSYQACTTFAAGAGVAITLPQVEEHIVEGKVDIEPFMQSVRTTLAPPDPFMNTMFSAIYLVASEPSFVEKYQRYQSEYDTDEERMSVAREKFMSNCETRAMRESLREGIIEGYERAAQL